MTYQVWYVEPLPSGVEELPMQRRVVAAASRPVGYPGALGELRFYLGSVGRAVRISYYIASGRRIILLTVFSKQQRRERAELARAERAMKRCIAEGHTAEDDSND